MIEDTKGGRRAQSTARRDEQCRANSRNLFNLSDEPISTKTPVEGATAEFHGGGPTWMSVESRQTVDGVKGNGELRTDS